MKVNFRPSWLNALLLLLWLSLSIGLRLWYLTAKPPWTDEFSTLVFSLGNSFLGVPLNTVISTDTLLQPLQPNLTASVQDVVKNLITESNHPPLYFVLTHLWTRLFATDEGLISLWGARSLAAIFGAFTVPGVYFLTWLTFRSRLASHLAAAIMAVSPYGIFLAQEARHYTLGILWVIASYAFMIKAVRHIQNRTQLPLWVTLTWIIINALGIATHYFFVFTLYTETVVFLTLAWWKRGGEKFKIHNFLPPPWRRILMVAVATAISGLIWVPVFLQNSYGDKLTDWIQGGRYGLAWISPIFQALAAWITMISLLPVESPNFWIIIASGLVMLIFFIWATPILIRGLKIQLLQPETRLMTVVLMTAIASAVILFFIMTYFLGIDLTRGARYNFVYYPAVIVLLGISMAICWCPPRNYLEKWQIQTPMKEFVLKSAVETEKNSDGVNVQTGEKAETISKWGIGGKKAVAIIWLMGLLSAVTVVCNLGYQKYYRPDLLVNLIQQESQVPILIATRQFTHVHIGEMMGIAREFKVKDVKLNVKNSLLNTPLFLLAHQDEVKESASNILQNNLEKLPRPFDLWLVNFPKADNAVSEKNCIANNKPLPGVHGYEYKIYHCQCGLTR